MNLPKSNGRFALYRNRILAGIAFLTAAVVLAYALYPLYLQTVRKTYPIVLMRHSADAGIILTTEDLLVSETPDLRLAEKLFSDPSQALGKTLMRGMTESGYLFREDAAEGISPPTIFNSLPAGCLVISVSISSPSMCVSGQLRADDIVRLYSIGTEGGAYTPAELQYIKILSVYSSNGLELDRNGHTANSGSDNGFDTPATLSLLATQEQALRIVELEQSGHIFFALVSRDDMLRSERLLLLQDNILASADGRETP